MGWAARGIKMHGYERGGTLKIRFCSNILLVIIAVVLTSCASAKQTVYNQEILQTISEWHLDFSYEPGRIEQKTESSGSAELKMVTEGRSSSDLQLLEDIFYCLQDKYGIKLTKTSNSSAGEIRIHPVKFGYGGFKSLDIRLNSAQGEAIGRVKINNGDRNATFKGDESFAIYSAEAIADMIKMQK